MSHYGEYQLPAVTHPHVRPVLPPAEMDQLRESVSGLTNDGSRSAFEAVSRPSVPATATLTQELAAPTTRKAISLSSRAVSPAAPAIGADDGTFLLVVGRRMLVIAPPSQPQTAHARCAESIYLHRKII